MLQNVLIIHNSSNAQSLTDAQAYVAARGLSANYMGVNWGTVNNVPTNAQMNDGTYSIQSLVYKGVADTSFNGINLGNSGGLKAVQSKYKFDGVILSTLTPMQYKPANWNPGAGFPYLTIPGAMGLWLTTGLDADFAVPGLPNGRLGCPHDTASAFNWNTEMTVRAGGSALTQCVTNGVASEANYNVNLPILTCSGLGTQGGASGGATNNISTFAATFFDSTYFAKFYATLAEPNTITTDLGNVFPFWTSLSYDFINGVVPTPINLYALIGPLDFNNPALTDPTTGSYSNNYRVQAGGWTLAWYSFQFYWAMNFIYNGGSAAFTTIEEPFAQGIIDPLQTYLKLLAGASMMECVGPLNYGTDLACATNSSAVSGGLRVSSARQTVLGDPLLRPFAKVIVTGVHMTDGVTMAVGALNGVTAAVTYPSNQILGSATNDSAPAGFLGEFITSTVAAGAAVALTTATPATIASINLTAGDWDVSGVLDFVTASTTNVSNLKGGLSSTAATFLAQTGGGGVGTDPNVSKFYFNFAPGVFTESVPVPTTRVSLAAGATIYLVAQGTFTVAGLSAYGTIRARRVR